MAEDRFPDYLHEIIQSLCLESGRIMENASAELALTLPRDISTAATSVQRLVDAAGEIQTFAAAAQLLLRSTSDTT